MTVSLAERVVGRVAALLDRTASRRGVLVKTTLIGSALAVAPLEFTLKPGTAYAFICRCGNPACACGSACCDGYTEFCCTITGSNTCPPGTFAGGWWRADGSSYCAGPRYYIDCHAECGCDDGCVPGGSPFCSPSCDGLTCDCAGGNCNNRAAGCVSFRYGQCHQEIACAGRIACRVVTCTPAYLLDNACSTTSMSDDYTAQHNAPCLQAPAVVRRAYAFAAAPGGGEWLAAPDGGVFAFDGAKFAGSLGGQPLDAPIVGIAAVPGGGGYWLVGADGGVFAFGSARFFGSLGGLTLVAPIVGITATPDGGGYWLVAADGGVFAFGSARFSGSLGGLTLVAPIVSMTATVDGQGYWLVASDGGLFSFGSAAFHGSMGGQPLSALIAGLAPTSTGGGYWLWGQDGTVYPFGDAAAGGSYGDLSNPQPPLTADGVDRFYGMTVQVASAAATPPTSTLPTVPPLGPGPSPPPSQKPGYTLWAIDPLGPPPSPHTYRFTTSS